MLIIILRYIMTVLVLLSSACVSPISWLAYSSLLSYIWGVLRIVAGQMLIFSLSMVYRS